MPDDEAIYSQIVERIFFQHYSAGQTRLDFNRAELAEAARELGELDWGRILEANSNSSTSIRG